MSAASLVCSCAPPNPPSPCHTVAAPASCSFSLCHVLRAGTGFTAACRCSAPAPLSSCSVTRAPFVLLRHPRPSHLAPPRAPLSSRVPRARAARACDGEWARRGRGEVRGWGGLAPTSWYANGRAGVVLAGSYRMTGKTGSLRYMVNRPSDPSGPALLIAPHLPLRSPGTPPPFRTLPAL